MEVKLKTHVYDVAVKPVKMDIENDNGRIMSDQEIGHIHPYGLTPQVIEDIEIKEKIEDSVVQKHINQEIEKHVVPNKSATSGRLRTKHK